MSLYSQVWAPGSARRSLCEYGISVEPATIIDLYGFRHRIIKRRVAWLIGEWMSGDEESAKLHIVWQLLLHLLSERGDASDRAVNLSAAVAIKECVDLWELPIDYFLPFLEQTVQEL